LESFSTKPRYAQNGIAREQYIEAKFGGPERAQGIYDNIRRVGETEGLEFRFDKIKRTPNTILAHRLISWSKHLKIPDLVVERLFKAYFFEGLDIGSMETLIELLEELEINTEAFKSYIKTDNGLDEVSDETRFAYENGITGVPCFIFDKKYSVSGAQEPEAFFPLFDLNINENDTG